MLSRILPGLKPEPNQLSLANSAEGTAGFLLVSDRVAAWSGCRTDHALAAVEHVAIRLEEWIPARRLAIRGVRRGRSTRGSCKNVSMAGSEMVGKVELWLGKPRR
jgi:hypothetical protein